MREIRYAIRSLLRTPAFTIATVLTLAIGIGAATAIYSVVDTILFRPLPFPGGDRLVRLIEYGPHFRSGEPPLERGINYQEHRGWRDRAQTIEEPAAIIEMAQRMVKTPDGAAGLWGAMVSGNTFALLRTRAHLGRTLQPADDKDPMVVVLNYDTWRRHYHSDPSIVGRSLEVRVGALLAPRPPMFLTVVGVLPSDFEFPTGRLDFVMPIVLDPSGRPPGVTTIARLAAGASLEAATQEANAMGTAMRQPWPADRLPPAGPRFEYQRLDERLVGPIRPALRVILSAVAVLLLIVCANVANLMLARGSARQREIAVRLAVGASRKQIAGLVVTESLVLAVAGGALGALVGAAGVTLVKALATIDAPGIFRLMFGTTILPRGHEVGVSWRLLAIAFGISATASVIFAILPAWQLSRTNHLQAIAARGSAASRGAARLRGSLVVGQLVLATVLLVGAGLLVASFSRLSSFDKGYDPSPVLAFNLLFPDTYSSPRKAGTIDALLTRLRTNPGVQAAGFARHGLLIGEELYIGRWVPPGRTLDEMRDARIRVRSVSDGFLTAMGVPLIEGRDLSPSDTAGAPRVVVVNRAMASRFFAGNPVGQIVDWHLGKSILQATVAGVAEDVRQEHATDELRPEIFVDYRQYMSAEETAGPGSADRVQNEAAIGFLSFAVRTSGDPAAFVAKVRETVAAIDPNIGIDAIAPMRDLEASAVARERFYAVILGVFASVAALLAAIGIYGVLAYAVAQRTQEIGVRMALGAEARQVMALILRRGLALTAIGLTIGLIGAAASARYLQSMLFGIEAHDAGTFMAVAVAFTGVALVASYFPARRATTVDPVVALRHE